MDLDRDQYSRTARLPGIGAYQWRPEEHRLIWSDDLARLYGFDSAPIGVGFDAFVHPDDREDVATETRSLLAAGGAYAREFRIVRADGAVRHIHDRGVVGRGCGQSAILEGVHIDVTPQRRPPALARDASAIDFREVAESLPQLVWTCDASGACDYLSPQWVAYTGASEAEQLGFGWLERLHPEDRERALARWREAADSGRSHSIEFRIRRHDGVYRWFRTLAAPLRDASGRVQKWFGSNTDIDDLKRLEGALVASEAEARARALEIETLYDAAPIGLVLFDRDFRFVRVNDRLAQINDARASALIGKRAEDVLTAATLTALRAIEPRLARGEDVEGTVVEDVDRVTGLPATFVVNTRPQRRADGTISHFLGTVQDITARRRAEEALVESEARFRGVFENAATGISIADLYGRYVSCNPAYTTMIGYSAGEILGRSFADFVHPDDRAAKLAQWARLVAGEVAAFEIENRYLRKGGGSLWARKHVSLLRDAGGRPTHVITLVTDMSEHKRHEARQQVLLHELNHRAKNFLALIQSVARQTAARSPGDFLPRFEERLQAISAAQDLLVRRDWREAMVKELIATQLAPVGGIGERVAACGDDVALSAAAAQTLGMAFHELATNAAKYGALSNDAGRVDISWSIGPGSDDEEDVFRLAWVESGGPPVDGRGAPGFGSVLVERLVRSAFGGEVEYRFTPEGVSWRLSCPAASVAAAG